MIPSWQGEPDHEVETMHGSDAASPYDPLILLEQLVPLLQWSTEPTLADAGLTVLSGAQLARVSAQAQFEANLCRERTELFLILLEGCAEKGAAPEADALLRLGQQLRHLARAQRRWDDLADNAAYYRDHPQVSAGIRQRLSGPGQARADRKE